MNAAGRRRQYSAPSKDWQAAADRHGAVPPSAVALHEAATREVLAACGVSPVGMFG